MAVARVLTWNLERRKPESGPGAAALEFLFDLNPDVMVLTEARTTMPARGSHVLWCEPPLGSWMGSDERKVLMWSKQPWVEVDRVGVSGLDNTRFVSAVTDTPVGPLRVVGVCVPWHMAGVQYVEDEKRSPWSCTSSI